MLTCGVVEVLDARSCVAARLARDVAARCSGVICIRPCAPGRRRAAVAEARLGVDDRRDQRRVEVLVARLLADDVLVAQRQRDLLDRLSKQRRDQRAPRQRRSDDRAHDASQPAATPARRRARARRAGARAARACWPCAAVIALKLVKDGGQRGLELLDRAVVAHDVRRPARPSPPG